MKPIAKSHVYRAFSSEVRKDLMEHHLSKRISDHVIEDGHTFGFRDEEIHSIVEACYKDLVRLRPD